MVARQIYSKHFLSGLVTSSASAVALRYTVPEDQVAIVKSVDIWVWEAGDVWFGRMLDVGMVPFVSSKGVTNTMVRSWYGSQVFEPGTIMGCEWVSGHSRVTASGYLLNV